MATTRIPTTVAVPEIDAPDIVPPVIGGAVGGAVLLVIVAAVVVVVCRRRSRPSSTAPASDAIYGKVTPQNTYDRANNLAAMPHEATYDKANIDRVA